MKEANKDKRKTNDIENNDTSEKSIDSRRWSTVYRLFICFVLFSVSEWTTLYIICASLYLISFNYLYTYRVTAKHYEQFVLDKSIIFMIIVGN